MWRGGGSAITGAYTLRSTRHRRRIRKLADRLFFPRKFLDLTATKKGVSICIFFQPKSRWHYERSEIASTLPTVTFFFIPTRCGGVFPRSHLPLNSPIPHPKTGFLITEGNSIPMTNPLPRYVTHGIAKPPKDIYSLRYTYDGTRKVRQLALGCESNWVKSTHDAYENTWKCGELKLYFSPSAGGQHNKKKDIFACRRRGGFRSRWSNSQITGHCEPPASGSI